MIFLFETILLLFSIILYVRPQFFCLFTEIFTMQKVFLTEMSTELNLIFCPSLVKILLMKLQLRDILNFKELLKHIPGTFI